MGGAGERKGKLGKWYNSILIKMFKRDHWAEFTMLCFKNCFRVCVGFLEVDGRFGSEVSMWSYPKTLLHSGWCLKASVCTDWKSLAWLRTVLHSSQSMCTSWTTCSLFWGFDALVNKTEIVLKLNRSKYMKSQMLGTDTVSDPRSFSSLHIRSTWRDASDSRSHSV